MRMSSQSTAAKTKSLRREMTLPEVLLWRVLRARPGGNKFRRQHPNEGIQTLCIPATEVLRDLEPVVTLIMQRCAARSPSTGEAGPPPLRMQGRI
jgi:very-short-patch-repair endonuclease